MMLQTQPLVVSQRTWARHGTVCCHMHKMLDPVLLKPYSQAVLAKNPSALRHD